MAHLCIACGKRRPDFGLLWSLRNGRQVIVGFIHEHCKPRPRLR